MSYASAVGAIAGAALVAILLSLLARAVVSHEFRRRHHEVGIAVFLQLGVIFAVLLAFVFSETWGEYNEAAQSINVECGALHEMAMMARTLPADEALPVLQALSNNIRAVVEQEWPTMASNRRAAPQARVALGRLEDVVARLAPADARGQRITGYLLDLLAQAHAARETRLFQLTSGLPGSLWALLIFYSVLLVLLVGLAGVESRPVLLGIVAVFAVVIASILVQIRLLDFPFEGALALSSQDFTSTLQKIQSLIQSPN